MRNINLEALQNSEVPAYLVEYLDTKDDNARLAFFDAEYSNGDVVMIGDRLWCVGEQEVTHICPVSDVEYINNTVTPYLKGETDQSTLFATK